MPADAAIILLGLILLLLSHVVDRARKQSELRDEQLRAYIDAIAAKQRLLDKRMDRVRHDVLMLNMNNEEK